MTTPPLKSPKQSSRWGSLLSGAVANLESRLDTILADESTIATRNAQLQGANATVASSAQSRSSSVHSSSTQPTGGGSRVPRPDANKQISTSRTSSQVRAASLLSSAIVSDAETKPRSSQESEIAHSVPIIRSGADPGSLEAETANSPEDVHNEENGRSSTPGMQYNLSTSDALNYTPTDVGDETAAADEHPQEAEALTLTAGEYQAQIAQMQSDYETAELQRQDEVHTYLERIDALQSKLQYLAKEAAESAGKAASQEPQDSLEKRLAAKDQQIALLMEEGQQLSKAEVAQSSAARKLRIKIAEDGKGIADMKQKLVIMERRSTEQAERIRKLEATQKDASVRLQRLPRLERETEILKTARDEKESTIQVLRQQIDAESKRADEAVKQRNVAAVEEQRKRNESLEEDLSNAKIERQLAEDRAKTELKAVQEELEREKERKKSGEVGLRSEISVLETRLESLRARTEEASSGTTNDAQAKLLRQVETLQSQYSLARENWQGIESSLQARVTALEKERAEITRQESEARKKARESGNNSRRLQESLDDVSRKCQVLEHDLTQKQAMADKLEARVLEFEHSLKDANERFEQERQTWDSTLANRIEEEKAKWRQEANSYAAMESPVAQELPMTPSFRRSNTLELPGFAARRPISRHASTELSIPMPEKTHSRKSSMRPGRLSDVVTSPNGLDSGRSTPFFNGMMPDTPSINEMDPDEMVETGSSPHRTVNDMISGSTSAAGPSVQLVERMSAKVRRLETEKAASKDEMARLSGQRDDARKEVVTLLREIEQKRAADAKVAKLESEMAQMEQRYQTTLEMLGEKSEKVEELEADVADLKQIYRDLADNAMK